MKGSHWNLAGFLAIMLCTACAAPTVVEPDMPSPTAAPPTQTAQPAQTEVPTAEPDRYRNEEGGFSLVLPAGWSVIGPLEIINRLDRPYNLYVLGAEPTPDGGPGSSKIIVANADLWTAEEFVQAQCSTCPAHPFEDQTLDGLPARRTLIGGEGVPFTITWVFIEAKDRLIGLAIHDPETLDPLEEVLQSIQF